MNSNMKNATFTSQQRFSAPQGKVQQNITVGVPKEQDTNKTTQQLVGLTPQAAQEFILNNHTVLIETNAGQLSGFTDEMYTSVGCQIAHSTEELYKKSKLIIKVGAPQKNEMQHIQKDQIIMAFFNFNHNENNNKCNSQVYSERKELFETMMKKQVICVDYEHIENDFGMRPVMQPMSEIAGHLAVQQGMKYLEKQMGGAGVLLGNVAGVEPSKVLVLGAGVAGSRAAKMAAATGAQVTLMDISTETLRQLESTLPKNVNTIYMSTENVNRHIREADLVIGAVIPNNNQFGRNVLNKNQVESMKKGSVLVDLAMWWGGNSETSQPTTMEQPTYMFNNVIHFCATNMWSSVPRYSSEALSAAALPFGLQLANKNWQLAAMENNTLSNGMIITNNNTTNEFLAENYNTQYQAIENLFKNELQQSNKNTNDLIQLKQQLQQFQNTTRKTQFTIEA